MQRINPVGLSTEYRVLDAAQADFEALYRLYCSNTEYFIYFNLGCTRERLRRDMTMLPGGCADEQKHFFVYCKDERPVAILDLIEGYPDADTCYIGLFMVCANLAGQGVGSAVITQLGEALAALGFRAIRLAYGKHYRSAEHFWQKNGFVPVKEAFLEEYGELIVAQRVLN